MHGVLKGSLLSQCLGAKNSVGGAIALTSINILSLSNNVLVGNAADVQGGGIFVTGSTSLSAQSSR